MSLSRDLVLIAWGMNIGLAIVIICSEIQSYFKRKQSEGKNE